MDKEARDQLTIARFEAGDINPALFDHEAHIYVAWQYIGSYARNDAIARVDEIDIATHDDVQVIGRVTTLVNPASLLDVDAMDRRSQDRKSVV